MNKNFLTGDTATAFKKLIGRYYWADDNIVVKHLIEVHEQFCGKDCPLEKSNTESEKGHLGIGPEESDAISPHRSETLQRAEECCASTEDPEKFISLQMEVEDGTESVDEDSSGESDPDMESETGIESGENQPPKQFKASTKNRKMGILWATKSFQDWHEECFGEKLDLRLVSPSKLSSLLCRFYCEVKAKPTRKHPQDTLYNRTTLMSIRYSLNNHLSDLNRQIDIVRGEEFDEPNRILAEICKPRLGLRKPTGHAKLIDCADLEKISIHLQGAYKSPVILLQAVWYLLSLHFVTRNTKLHQHLKINSFEFKTDQNGEYAIVKSETMKKEHCSHRALGVHIHKRMYALETDRGLCPVKLLKLMIKKTDKNATLLFNKYRKRTSPGARKWYLASPFRSEILSSTLHNLCKDAGVNTKYSFQCLRETAITYISDQGFDPQHLMNKALLHNKGNVR
ncbi:uncharacterized protein LOC134269550 [Saccostrea cucullata]|uniref:uncharacterized protein LOC134269550 n=1 Tax=Saccostrea cuccullata TaxID=36930 RepID=UPI002ED535DA